MIDKYTLSKSDDKFICSENGLFINIGLSDSKEEFIVVYHGDSNDRKVSCIDLYNPQYLYYTGKFSRNDRDIFVSLIYKYWNNIKTLYKSEYNNIENPDYDIYKEAGKDKIKLPDNPPNYTLLETID